jgi:muramoyltetrapeptide carboxypeptidase
MTTRAQFLHATSMAAVAGLTAVPSFPSGLAKPPMLRRGDIVGLVAPASPLSSDEIDRGIAHMHALGLRVRLGAYVRERDGFLAGTDAQRARDFNAMARDPQVRAIVAFRGGYGSMRILDMLDYDALARDPKVVLGFSDITAILNALTRRSRIVTFHGPVAALDSTYDAIARAAVERAVMRPEPIGALRAPGARVLKGGKARGPLAGGNLTLVASLTGTPYAVAASGALLFLEDTNEEPYQVDRMLTQLHLAGTIRAANGLIFGQCTNCEASGPSSTIGQVLADQLGHADRPAISGVPIGHIDDQWVLPIGIPADLDADARTLTVLESGVS